MLENFPEKHLRNGQKNDQTERARGLGSKTREEIGKGNQKDSPEIPGREKDMRHPWPPCWGLKKWAPLCPAHYNSQAHKLARCSPVQYPVHSHVSGGGQQKFPRKWDPWGVGVVALEDLHQEEDEDWQQEALACTKHTWKKRVTPSAGVTVLEDLHQEDTPGNRSVTRSAGIAVLKEFQFHQEEDDTNHDRVSRCHFPRRDPHKKRLRHTTSKYFYWTQTDLETIWSCSTFCVNNKPMAVLEYNVQDGGLVSQREKKNKKNKESVCMCVHAHLCKRERERLYQCACQLKSVSAYLCLSPTTKQTKTAGITLQAALCTIYIAILWISQATNKTSHKFLFYMSTDHE